MTNKNIKLYKTDNKLGFDYYGTFMTDCFESDCGRFLMDPYQRLWSNSKTSRSNG